MVALNVIFSCFACLLCVALALWQIYANRRHAALVSFSTRHLPACLFALAFMTAVSAFAARDSASLLAFNLTTGIFPLLLLASSFLPRNMIALFLPLAAGVMADILHMFAVWWWDCQFTSLFYSVLTLTAALGYVVYFIVSLWLYIRRIRNVVQKTTVWTMLALSVDVVYIFSVVCIAVLQYSACQSCGRVSWVTTLVADALLVLTAIALGYRISTDSLFSLMRRHETIILESLNDAPFYMTGDRTAPDDQYKLIFDRVVDYFETDLPFLRGDLVIEDLVKVVYANKLYISRAISRCAGRNFCQFVNYYRVRHSVEVFKKNPDLKVTELAGQCGFNSVVSFTMAFKLYMKENPSEWMRKERARMIKYGP